MCCQGGVRSITKWISSILTGPSGGGNAWGALTVQTEDALAGCAACQRIWGNRRTPPTITLIFVTALAHPDMLKDTDVVAIMLHDTRMKLLNQVSSYGIGWGLLQCVIRRFLSSLLIRVTEHEVPEGRVVFALWDIEIPRTQRVFDREGQAHLPGIAVDVSVIIFECDTEFLGHERARCLPWHLFVLLGIKLLDKLHTYISESLPRSAAKGRYRKSAKYS